MLSPDALPNVPELQLLGSCGQGQAWQAGRLKIVSTTGSPQDVGYQHGMLLCDDAAEGAVRQLASAARNLDGIRDLPTPKRQIARLVVANLYRKIGRNLSVDYHAEIGGLAKGLNIPSKDVFRASFLSEVLQGLVAATGFGKSEAVSKGGCTAAVALNGRSGIGVLHGKNQDYDAAGHWDKSPAVVITRISGSKAYAKVTSAGLLKGNLSMNEAGLTIGGHMLFSSRSGKSGRSFTALENDVMRNASSLGEAVDIFRKGPRLGCFAFVITDGRQDSAAVIECDGDTVDVREASKNTLGMSNIYMASAELRKRDILVQGAFDRNPVSRQNRVDAMLQDETKPVDLARIASILADLFDPASNRVRSVAHTIASVMTVTSAIARPSEHELWVGEDLGPTSIGRYIGFNLSKAFDGGEPIIVGTIEAGKETANYATAMRHFMAARLAYEEANDPETALKLLEQGRTSDPSESAFNRTIARLLIRAQRFQSADAELLAINLGDATPNERAEIAILRGHIADVRGLRSSALQLYADALKGRGAQDDPLRRIALPLLDIAQRHLSKPFSANDALQIAVPFSQISGIE
jgi:Acyl-coenzyme A:6-aminopenicillanic acid acyl-transferase